MNHFLTLPLRVMSKTIQHIQISMKLFKGFIRKYFSRCICQYVLGRNIMKLDLFLLNMIVYEVMPYINIFGMKVGNWIIS